MGPRNRVETQYRTCEGVKYPLVGSGTGGVGRVHQGTCGKQTYSPLEIAVGFSLFLCEEEGWEATARPGLSEIELSYHQELIPSSADLGDHAHAP
jgi:hypothetical protein